MTTHEKVVASRPDCEHEHREFIVESGASLHMMSKNELPLGEKDTIRRSKEPTVITTSTGKAESTEEATVCDNDLDAVVTMMLTEDSPAGAISKFIVRRTWAILMNVKGRVSIVD